MKAIFKVILYVGIIISFLFATNLNLYKTNYYNPNSCIFRRIRGIQTKEELAINYFIGALRVEFGTNILETYIIPKEIREEEERIDIIVIYEGIERDELLDIATDIGYYICKKYDEVIIPITLSKEQRQNIPDSLDGFYTTALNNILAYERKIKNIEQEDINPSPDAVKGHYKVGKVLLKTAKKILKDQTIEEERFFDVFINAFFSCERFISAIILNSGQEPLAKSHGGLIRQFKNVSGIKDEWWKKMDRLLIKRISYFYRATEVTDELIKDVNEITNLAEELEEHIRSDILNI